MGESDKYSVCAYMGVNDGGAIRRSVKVVSEICSMSIVTKHALDYTSQSIPLKSVKFHPELGHTTDHKLDFPLHFTPV